MLDRPTQAAAEGLPILTRRAVLAIENGLDAVGYLVDAVYMAAFSIEEPRQVNAIQELARQISKEITALQDKIEAIGGEQ